MKTNIFPQRNQVVSEILLRNDRRCVLIVPIDFAKKSHVVQLCRGTGEYLLRQPLTVHNDSRGVDFLLEKVRKCQAKYRIPTQNIILGGEDPPEYVWNFVAACRARGYQFVRVNAKEAKTHRANSRSVSDKLALDGITQTILLQRSYEIREQDEIYDVMKMASRSRSRFRWQETALKNRIHRQAEVLFPGFLSENKSGVFPFSEACLDLMEEDFSVMRIKRMRTSTIQKHLRKNGVHKPDEKVAKLRKLADATLLPEPATVPYLAKSLTVKVQQMRCIRNSIQSEENEMARSLVQTPEFIITSIPGLGVVLTGTIIGEYGCEYLWPDIDKMASYAGIVPRNYQTGGPDKPPIVTTLPFDANHKLKNALLQSAFHVGTTRHPAEVKLDLKGKFALYEFYQTSELNDRCSRLATAKKMLRTIRAMVRDSRVYMPYDSLEPSAPGAMSPETHIQFMGIVKEMMINKWKGYDLSGIPEEKNHLAKWLKEVNLLIEVFEQHK